MIAKCYIRQRNKKKLKNTSILERNIQGILVNPAFQF